MKRSKKFITVFLSVMMMFYSININVYASGGTFDEDAFSHGIMGYYMQDSENVPEGSYFFYKYEDGKAWYCTLQKAIALCANKSYGMSFSPDVLIALASGFMSFASSYTGGIPINGRAVWKGDPSNGGIIVGYALNGISGCKIVNPTTTYTSNVESEINNFINVYVTEYIENNYGTPDYINVIPYTKEYAKNMLPINATNYQNKYNWISNITDTGFAVYTRIPNIDVVYDVSFGKKVTLPSSNTIFYMDNINNFNLICTSFACTYSNPVVDMQELPNMNMNVLGTGGKNIYGFDKNTGTTYTNNYSCTITDFSNNSVTTSTGTYPIIQGGTNSQTTYGIIGDKPITVYKNPTITNQVLNNTYAPNYMISNETNNYDNSSTTNDYSFTSNEVDNSVHNNQNIYYDQKQEYIDNSYYNSENNYYIDNSQVTTTNSTIINNYYGDGSGGSGSGGDDNNNDDDDDDTIWKALLKAIADFFKKIGELIATVLTGIVTILTSILDAIANIVTDFTGITDFIGQIFSWLPSDIVTLMTLGLTTALFAAFLTWFKK